MRRILAIANISMRTAFRSKIFLTLLTMLLLVIVAIPLTVKGDGTLSGYVRILIEYTLNFVRFILAVAAIWAGCAAISQEVENKQIQMTATKPIHPLALWLGKWTGIVVPISLLVLLSGGIIYGVLMYNLRSSQLDDSERQDLRKNLLVGRSRLLPQLPEDLEARVETAFAELREHGEVPPHVSDYELRNSIRNTLIVRRQTVEPGQTCNWSFDLPELHPDRTVAIECKVSSSILGGVLFPGRLKISSSDGETIYSATVDLSTELVNSFDLPGDLFTGLREVVIEFENLSTEQMAIFPAQESILMLAYSGGFELNYLRTLLIVIFQLAFLTAIAVTMGAAFSTPVAAFVSIFMLLLVFMDGYIQEMSKKIDYSAEGHSHGHQHAEPTREGPGITDTIINRIFVTADLLAAPLRQPDPLELCATGIYVSWKMLGQVLVFHFVIYSGAFALLGSSIFKRRELALPQR